MVEDDNSKVEGDSTETDEEEVDTGSSEYLGEGILGRYTALRYN